MVDVGKKISLGQVGGTEDHAARVMREKIGDVRGIEGEGVGTVFEGFETGEQKDLLGKIVEVLRTVFDPEIPLNVYDLGLIYKVSVDGVNAVKVEMTLTAPGCPVAGEIVAEVRRKVDSVSEVAKAEVELVWEPMWTRERLTEAARLELGM